MKEEEECVSEFVCGGCGCGGGGGGLLCGQETSYLPAVSFCFAIVHSEEILVSSYLQGCQLTAALTRAHPTPPGSQSQPSTASTSCHWLKMLKKNRVLHAHQRVSEYLTEKGNMAD